MTSKQNKFKIEKRKLLAIPLIVCLSVTMCFGTNFSKVFASGYVTDDLTVKIGYWGMDESTFVEKGTYNWYTLASSLPMHKVAYSFYQENKYGYNTIIDSAKGFYIGDFLDFAGIERSGINSISRACVPRRKITWHERPCSVRRWRPSLLRRTKAVATGRSTPSRLSISRQSGRPSASLRRR